MPIELSQGFRFGAFTAEPLKGSVARDDGPSRHLAPKAMDVLVRLAEAAPKPVTREDLITAVWGERYVSDEVLTHAIKELRHALDDSPTQPRYIQTIPKRGYRLLRKARPIVEPTPVKDGRKRRYLAIAASLFVAVLALGWFVGDLGQDTESTVAPAEADAVTVSGITVNPSKRIAVLPFLAMSSDENDGYFADGLAEEIRNSLTQLPELQVTARTSSEFFKGKDMPVNEIANLLNVAHIVEGSVRRDGERLRITSQLIRAADGFQLWSQTYDRPSDDIFAIQQDIAEKVAEALDVVLDDEALARMSAMRINDVDAFIAYQKGIEYFNEAHSPSVVRFGNEKMAERLAIANTYLDTALEAQPDLVGARFLKSDRAQHILLHLIRLEEPDIDKVREQLKAYRDELDLIWRTSPSGNQRDIIQLEKAMAGDDWTGLSTLIEKALQPGDCPKFNWMASLAYLGFANEVAKKYEERLACNPLDPITMGSLANAYVVAGRPEESLRLLDRAEAAGVIGEISDRFYRQRIGALVVAGQFDLALQYSATYQGEFFRYFMRGDEAEAQRIAEQAWAPDTRIGRSLRYAALLGDRVRANEYAARYDKYPGSASILLRAIDTCVTYARLAVGDGCRDGVPFDLEATPNLKARIEESGLQWPPVSFRDASNEAP